MRFASEAVIIGLALLLPAVALGDVGPPAHMQITEIETGLYSVQWRVPSVLPPRAVPEPAFPETCRPEGERSAESQAGAWLFTREWRCEEGLAGQVVGMHYPFPDLALTTVVRVDLLSGDRFAHVLTPGEGPWRIPEGTAAPDVLLGARRAVVAGASHVLGSYIHIVFLVVLGLLGDCRQVIRIVSVFTLGQAAGAVVARLTGGVGPVPAAMLFAACVAVLARQALASGGRRRGTLAPVAAAGVFHGLAIAVLISGSLGAQATGLHNQVLAILGMDAAYLAIGAGLAALWSLASESRLAPGVLRAGAYGTGSVAVALAVALAFGGGGAGREPAGGPMTVPGGRAEAPAASPAASQRVAPTSGGAPVESFITVEPFEVRLETMVLLAGMAGELGLDPGSTLGVEIQPEITRRLADMVLGNSVMLIDGQSPAPLLRSADFMEVDPTGALPRTRPVPEAVGEAVVGVTVVYPAAGMPGEVSFTWAGLPATSAGLPVTLIDPEAAMFSTLSVTEPVLTWENRLVEDPMPSVAAVQVEPYRLPLPWLSLPLLAILAGLVIRGLRGRQAAASLAAARVVLALAIAAGPLLQTAVALPGTAGRPPSEREARRILAGLLPNIYRAMEFRNEATIYDRLAISVTGEALTDVYLGQRRGLLIEERGGAQARVEAVEVLDAGGIESRDNGFAVRSAWTVGGMVTHFGHRHFRQNRYDARIEVVPVEGSWKIRSIEVLEQERIL